MAANDIITRLRMQGQAAYVSAAGQASTALGGMAKQGAAADRAVEGVGKTSGKAAGPVSKVAGSIRGFVAGAAAAYGAQQIIGDAVKNAVDLGEQMNKTSVVFRGPGAASIQEWSKTSAKAIGVSRAEALEATGVLGNMLVPMGFARDKAAQMSKRMVQLGGDMASFNNASPEQTLDALRAGLAGETEPLRRFGVFLNDARLKQEAMNMGLYEGKGPLDAQAKAAATYAVILKDTKDAQGDFTRTSDSLANQQRILRAQYANLTATIGQKLIPVLSWMIKNLPELAIIVGSLVLAWGIWTATSALAAAGTLSLSGAFTALTGVLLANPIGLILIGLVALGAALVIAYRKVDWFRAAVDAAFAFVKRAAVAVFGWIKGHWPLLVGILTGPFGLAAALVIKHWDKIVAFVRALPGRIAKAASGMWDGIKDAFRSAVNWIIGAWNGLEFRIPGFDPPGPGPKFGGFTLGLPNVPLLASGGFIQRAGAAIVGERGPELVSLPAGAQVAPASIGASGLGRFVVEVPVYLNQRQIALAVADDTSDRIARR